MKRYRIYYGDGSTYDGDPFLAPQTNVQVVLTESTAAVQGFTLACKHDRYYWNGTVWTPCDEAGMWDYLLMYRGPKALLFGRTTVRDEDFWATVTRARREGLG